MPIFENVVPALARALEARGFESLTAVQTAVMAPELQAADLLVSAQTGSGKTVAFGLNLATTLLDGKDKLQAAAAPLALIIAPTRELAMQVRGELEWLYAPIGGRIASCVGGMDMRDERRVLSHGAHIVVGTPGRLVDHIRRGSLQMDGLKAVVLDEADEMLNLGFREELEHILEASPASRRTLMFSATMPRGIEGLAKTYQRDAVRVNTASGQKQHADIEYRALMTAGHDAENAIFNVLRYYDATNAIVFCGTRAAVTRLESRLSNRGLSVVALSGELSQSARTHALQAMRDHRAQVCVATDVAARGIDLPDLELVIHADLPKNTEGLLHRSGRTGRAGRKGASVLIVPYSSRRGTERLLNMAGIQAQWGAPPSADDIKRRDDQRLLADPLLQTPPEKSDESIVRELLDQHDAAHIAAAFVRLYRKGQAAPEDLAPAPDWSDSKGRPERAPRERAPRDMGARDMGPAGNFEGGAWISLSVGRTKQAEPRWLIPMLCKAGGLTKRQLGNIRIEQNETYVEIDAGSVDDFMARVGGDGGTLEKSIRVSRMMQAPSGASEPRPRREAPRDGPRRDGPRSDGPRDRDARPPRNAEGRAERPAYANKSEQGAPRVKPKKTERTPFKGPRPDSTRQDAKRPHATRDDAKRPHGKHADKKRPDTKRSGPPPSKKSTWHPVD
jgi:ATP-dependent RNA helicase DeaD